MIEGENMSEESLIFKSYQRGLLRQLNKQKEAMTDRDYEAAEKLLDDLIADTKADIEE